MVRFDFEAMPKIIKWRIIHGLLGTVLPGVPRRVAPYSRRRSHVIDGLGRAAGFKNPRSVEMAVAFG